MHMIVKQISCRFFAALLLIIFLVINVAAAAHHHKDEKFQSGCLMCKYQIDGNAHHVKQTFKSPEQLYLPEFSITHESLIPSNSFHSFQHRPNAPPPRS